MLRRLVAFATGRTFTTFFWNVSDSWSRSVISLSWPVNVERLKLYAPNFLKSELAVEDHVRGLCARFLKTLTYTFGTMHGLIRRLDGNGWYLMNVKEIIRWVEVSALMWGRVHGTITIIQFEVEIWFCIHQYRWMDTKNYEQLWETWGQSTRFKHTQCYLRDQCWVRRLQAMLSLTIARGNTVVLTFCRASELRF